MNLFFMVAGAGGEEKRFLQDVLPLFSKDKLEVFYGFSALAERLRRPRDTFSTVILFGPSAEDLKRMAPLREFIKDARILLVLGDQTEETIALAHKVLPTYISDIDNGTSGIVSVLKQLIKDARAHEVRT